MKLKRQKSAEAGKQESYEVAKFGSVAAVICYNG